jgi:hypothetical protein
VSRRVSIIEGTVRLFATWVLVIAAIEVTAVAVICVGLLLVH